MQNKRKKTEKKLGLQIKTKLKNKELNPKVNCLDRQMKHICHQIF